jgi:hypothetical protein
MKRSYAGALMMSYRYIYHTPSSQCPCMDIYTSLYSDPSALYHNNIKISMTLFQKGNEEWRKSIPVLPKEQDGSVRKRRILSWMEFITGRSRKTIDTFFLRNTLEFNVRTISTYITVCKMFP